MKYTLSILVQNQTGVLNRISSLFARRGYNIESIAIGASELCDVSRITVVLPATDHSIKQIVKQLSKLIDVIRVENLTDTACVHRELMLLKVNARNSNRRQKILEIVSIFRAHIVDFAIETLTIEVVGDPGKIAVIRNAVREFGIVEVARTGRIALSRELGIDSESLKKSDNIVSRF